MTRLALLFTLTLVAFGCGSSPTSPAATTTTTTSATSLNVFEGVLSPGGSAFYSFTSYAVGPMNATFASLQLAGHHEALAAAVRLGVGTPKGEGCAASQTADLTPALISQFSATISTGIYCLSITDIGNLTGDATFQLRFTAP